MSTEYEYSVIGSAMADPKTIPHTLRHLRRDDFSDEFGRLCFDLLQSNPVMEEKEVLGFVRRLQQKGISDPEPVLSEAIRLAFPSRIETYCRFVREDAQKRKLAEIIAESPALSVRDLRDEISRVFDDSERDSGVKDREAAIREWLQYYSDGVKDPGRCRCRTGYPRLDRCLGGGLINGGLYIVGARPGMGKTTFTLNMADRISNRGDAVLYVSLEMSSVQITAKTIALEGGLSYTDLLNVTATPEQYDAAVEKCGEMLTKPFRVLGGSGVTVAGIEAAAREYPDLKCIFIDYLGLIAPAGRKSGLYEQITEISRELKLMAGRLAIPVVCLCQLNRSSTQLADKKPKLSDLRDSGAIEQDADGVLLLYRDDYYRDEFDPAATGCDESATGVLEVCVAKNRHGEAMKTVPMTWYGRSGLIMEME